MDRINVYVIFNNEEFEKHDVIQEIREEGYQHNFYFPRKGEAEMNDREMNKADEVWCFGDCKSDVLFKIAVEKGKDIWFM